MNFCDFCDCDACVNGDVLIEHAQTEDGRYICNVCYKYDVCIDAWAAKGQCRGPCGDREDDPPCTHRPKLVTEWLAKEAA